MRTTILSLVLLLAVPVFAEPPVIGVPFTLAVGQSEVLAGTDLVVGFDQAVEETRCPTGVECPWEGDASARLWAELSGLRSEFVLHTLWGRQRSETIAPYVVTMLEVNPFPHIDIQPDLSKYVLTILVTPATLTGIEDRTWGAIKRQYQ